MRRVRTVPRLLRRGRGAHKGDFGTALIIGGSRGMIGAPALAARAALRSGAGLVVVACPASIQLCVAGLCPCATSIPLAEESGVLDLPASIEEFRGRGLLGAGKPSVAAIGPGLGRGNSRFDSEVLSLCEAFLEAEVPLVIDADALNALHKAGGNVKRGWNEVAWRRTVITPHPGELGRLQGIGTDEIQAQREAWAGRTAREMSSKMEKDVGRPVVVLKGAGTVVSDAERIYKNATGNPGMATGGSGDVLTGVIAALIGQRMSPFDAAVLGVHVHGMAGDLAAKKLGEVSMTASDLIDFLPDAFRRMK